MMNKTAPKFYSLSRRIVFQFCLFTLVLTCVYGVISFLLMYTLEDSFIEQGILQEAAYLKKEYQRSGSWPAPASENMQIHFSKATFPADIKQKAMTEPRRAEFYGQDGRHYHLYTFNEFDDVYLLAEVSGELVVRSIRSGVIQFLVLSSLSVTIIACLLAWLTGRRTVKPLQQLSELVDSVAPTHIANKFSDKFPNNEIGILARTLEQTLSRIDQALEREKCFTRDVSHELRTPLSVIKNSLELYQSSSTSSESSTEIMIRVSEAAEHMDKTVNTLLMLAREENNSANKHSIDLMPIIERSVLDNCILLNGKKIDINVSNNCQVKVIANPGMLKVLLDNVLSNAFQYTVSGEVVVDYANEKLIIKDSGPGIQESISESITTSGVKGDKSLGYGFGLSIVKRLCDQQGWQLRVAGDNGTTVCVSFV